MDKGVNLCVAENVSEIRLHLAVSAASEAEELKACAAHQLHRVAHAGAAGAYAMGEARTEDSDAVLER